MAVVSNLTSLIVTQWSKGFPHIHSTSYDFIRENDHVRNCNVHTLVADRYIFITASHILQLLNPSSTATSLQDLYFKSSLTFTNSCVVAVFSILPYLLLYSCCSCPPQFSLFLNKALQSRSEYSLHAVLSPKCCTAPSRSVVCVPSSSQQLPTRWKKSKFPLVFG